MTVKTYLLFKMYGRLIILIVLLILAIYWNKAQLRFINTDRGLITEDHWLKRNEDKVNNIVRKGAVLLAVLGIVICLPNLRDLKGIVTNDYEVESGTLMYQEYESDAEKKDRIIKIETTDGEVEKFKILHCPLLKEGQTVNVYYLEYSHYGFIYE